jgi:hypothetical protein
VAVWLLAQRHGLLLLPLLLQLVQELLLLLLRRRRRPVQELLLLLQALRVLQLLALAAQPACWAAAAVCRAHTVQPVPAPAGHSAAV